ncbi:unnamed protein product, partial [Symbiodinium sp. KB8]
DTAIMVRSAAAVFAGNCLVAATLIDSWLPWRTLSSGNQTGLPSTDVPPSPPVMGDPPQGATSTSTTSVWWGEWNFRVLLGWTNLMVFSTPEQKGSLGTEGGWALYLLDKVDWDGDGHISIDEFREAMGSENQLA